MLGSGAGLADRDDAALGTAAQVFGDLAGVFGEDVERDIGRSGDMGALVLGRATDVDDSEWFLGIQT